MDTQQRPCLPLYVPRPALPAPRADGKLSAVLRASEEAWEAIQRLHDEVPPCVISCASAGPRMAKWGHWWASQWAETDGKRTGEVFLAAEGLRRPAEQVFGTLLHESAHALNWTRKVEDTSQDGRYHNKHFARAASELGLEVAKAGHLGFAFTTVSEATRETYEIEIAVLEAAMHAHRLQQPQRAAQRDKNLKVAVCGCGRKIRAAKGELAEPDIVCGRCGHPFTMMGA